MARIVADFAGMEEFANQLAEISSGINKIRDAFEIEVHNVDDDLKNRLKEHTRVSPKRIIDNLEYYARVLRDYENFILTARDVYQKIDQEEIFGYLEGHKL